MATTSRPQNNAAKRSDNPTLSLVNLGIRESQIFASINEYFDRINYVDSSTDIASDLTIPKITQSDILKTSKDESKFKQLDEELKLLLASKVALHNARKILNYLTEEIDKKGLQWIQPIIYLDDTKSICIEWRRNDRHLYFDIDEDRSRYSKMQEVGEAFETMPGNIANSELLTLWVWLLHEKE